MSRMGMKFSKRRKQNVNKNNDRINNNGINSDIYRIPDKLRYKLQVSVIFNFFFPAFSNGH